MKTAYGHDGGPIVDCMKIVAQMLCKTPEINVWTLFIEHNIITSYGLFIYY